jgi:hypothetical protein
MKKFIWFMTLLLVVSFCSGSNIFAVQDHPDYDLEYPKEAPQPVPQEGKAIVFFIRPAFVGLAIPFYQYANEQLVGITKGKCYFFCYASPGESTFRLHAENNSEVKVNIEAGKIYYFQQEVLAGIGKARGDLLPLSATEAASMMEKCKYVTFTLKPGKN